MKIGEFVTLLQTTKDTVRHYEELNLITPKWNKHYKEYSEKEVLDFQVVRELKEYGLSLSEIQLIFSLKDAYSCGDKELVNKVFDQLNIHLDTLQKEEAELRRRRIALEKQMEEIRDII
ncbi:MerR family transcriptional regulator [Bacillus sp. BHET2]|uniref:MerR family transcriptional regulator n=1 Tax=Bacillus sp. BHET2 TaxID=2583818 RepID=UPI00110D4E20|nr:MerR family transcriptional regulator [Bacillus sp. BHET2]TMU85815.1 MerR family transcriptional regulator [Bacillus sp. BHET2]